MAESTRGFKNAIYEQFARIGNAVGSPRRLELLDLLCQCPRTVEALSRQAGQSLANTAHHPPVLRRAGPGQGRFIAVGRQAGSRETRASRGGQSLHPRLQEESRNASDEADGAGGDRYDLFKCLYVALSI